MNENIKHIAIIMDGNGRWGVEKYNSRTEGHKKGAETLKKIISSCIKNNIEILSVYAFSTENWNRPTYEVNTLMWLFKNYLENEKENLNSNGIRLIVSGSERNVSSSLLKSIKETSEFLKSNKKLTLNICFNYGGRQEIVDAVNKIIKEKKENISIDEFNNYLYNNLPDPDIIIRTGGDFRISNFLLWQIAYSELYFTDCLWPDFDENEFEKAIKNYKKRDRRFGGLNEIK